MADANACPCFQSDEELWKSITIGLAVAVSILSFAVIVLVIIVICQCRQIKAKPQGRPDPENAPCNRQDGVHYDNVSGEVSVRRFGIGSSVGSSLEYEGDPQGFKVSTKPLVKRNYDVSGGTPSTQPLLASSTLPGDTVASETVTSISGHIGDNVKSLQNTPPSSTSLHEAPTAPYRESLPTSPSCSAFEKAEGQCGTSTQCTEWHADFVKDNIDVNTHIDFFYKLGLSKKDCDATMYDSRNEKTRDQIRHVIIDDFIGKEDNPSIYRLLSALEASGNKYVSRQFREKFHVTSSAGY